MTADYQQLRAYLADCSEDTVTVTWSELDALVDGLPDSAVTHHPQWWHGDRSHTRAWRQAGYELVDVHLRVQVSFQRTDGRPPAASSQPRPVEPAARSATTRETVGSLLRLDPLTTLTLVTCSATKTEGGFPAASTPAAVWPAELYKARQRQATRCAFDESRLLPAWQRYHGHFYAAAGASIGAAAAAHANVIIISGGYGLLRLDEPIGSYDRAFNRSDWPPGLLERLLIDQARRPGIEAVVAFTSASTGYGQLVARTAWAEISPKPVLHVTGAAASAAMVRVPKTLGAAFASFWSGNPATFPAGAMVRSLG